MHKADLYVCLRESNYTAVRAERFLLYPQSIPADFTD